MRVNMKSYYVCGSEEHYARNYDLKKEILDIGMKVGKKYNEQKSQKPSKARQSNK
jgi:hypothetical protein